MVLFRRFGETVKSCLLSKEAFRPYPSALDRKAWEALPERLRHGQTTLAESYLDFEWPSLPATLFMEFERSGNRRSYEARSFLRRTALENLVVAECIEDEGRFADDIINGIWAICEESFWGVPAHNGMPDRPGEPLPDVSRPIVDLFAAETAGLLAWVCFLLKPRLDKISRLVCDRIERETKRRVIDPFLKRDDFWWMGLRGDRKVNNWNPWCTSNCLTALLLLEEDETRRVEGVRKSLRILDAFLDTYPPDGGCDEGSSYWNRAGGSLFDCLDLLYLASDGRIDAFDDPLVAEIGRYIVRMHISGDFFVNFADGSAKLGVYGGGSGFSPALVYRYGRRIGDQELQAFGIARHRDHQSRAPRMQGPLLRRLPALFMFGELDETQVDPPLIRDVWLEQTQVMVAREEAGSDRGLYVAAKGGHNGESHNHNDVGNFIVYAHGRPILIDAGVGTYTKKTFSSKRYEIWTMRSAFHNLPTIGGCEQQAGERFRAANVSYACDDSCAEIGMDLTAAYPREAGIVRWHRFVRLYRGGEARVEIVDDFELERARTVTFNLMAPDDGEIEDAGAIVLDRDTRTVLHYDAGLLEAAQERVAITDERLGGVWGKHINRIQLTTKRAVRSGIVEIRIGINQL